MVLLLSLDVVVVVVVVVVRKHSKESNDLEDHSSVERLVEKLILPSQFVDEEVKSRETARLIHTFWKEYSDFANMQGQFQGRHIWYTAEDEGTNAYEWHKNYSYPFALKFLAVLPVWCVLNILVLVKQIETGKSLREIRVVRGQYLIIKNKKAKAQTVVAGA